jgi:acylphosphatase
MIEVHHATAFYSGRVQGVGFRYAALQVAREFEVNGYAENLADGRVRVEVEGGAADVDAYLDALAERMHGYIRKAERTAARRSAQFTGFTIR